MMKNLMYAQYKAYVFYYYDRIIPHKNADISKIVIILKVIENSQNGNTE